jgi:tyrosine aminotransferase
MENGAKTWNFWGNNEEAPSRTSVRAILMKIMGSVDKDDPRPTVPLGPSPFPSFRTTAVAEEAIVDAVRSAKFNSYPPTNGIVPARR